MVMSSVPFHEAVIEVKIDELTTIITDPPAPTLVALYGYYFERLVMLEPLKLHHCSRKVPL